jgi:2-isopropylmalate synthase
MKPNENGLIYDWNRADGFRFRHREGLQLNDETLRDGLQSPSVRDPSVGQKLEILHLMEELGLDACDIGLPGAGRRALEDIERLAREIARERMRISPNVAVRTVLSEIEPVIELSQRVGLALSSDRLPSERTRKDGTTSASSAFRRKRSDSASSTACPCAT